MTCVLPELNKQTNELQDKKKQSLEELGSIELQTMIYHIIMEHKDNLSSPDAKLKMKESLNQYASKLAQIDIKNENDKLYNNQHIEKSIKEYNKDIQDFIVRDRQDAGVFPGFMGSLLKFFNKNYKGLTIGSALGRVFTEATQTSLLVASQKISNLGTAFMSDKFLLGTVGFDKNYAFPEVGKINKHSLSETGDTLLPVGNAILDMLSKPSDFLMKLQSKTVDPVLTRMENSMFQSLFKQTYVELAIKESKLGADKYSPIDKSNEFLFKENITPENRSRKMRIIEKAKRIARDEAAKLFFDYRFNPLIVHKMEQYIPFTNFFYSGVRMLSKYPKTFLFAATALNNIQYAYGEGVFYMDDEGERVDAGVSLRMPILASIGLGGVNVNMQRFLQFSPASVGLSPIPIFSFLTNREDFRWKDFYKKGDMGSLQNVALGMMGPTIQQLFQGIEGLDKPIDPKTKENATAKITQALAYMATGTVIKDKTQAQAWKWYIDGDYSNLLSLSQLQLNQFFKHPSNANKGITIDSIRGAVKAQELGLMDSKWEQNPKRQLLLSLSGLELDKNMLTPKEFYDDTKQIKNLVEMVAGTLADGETIDPEFYDKCLAFSKSSYFKNFKDFNPTMYKTYKHYADNYQWYKDRDKAMKMMFDKDAENSRYGRAMNLAIKYEFEGTEGMKLEDKIYGIINGKITKPKFSAGNAAYGLPPGPLMTEGYFNSLDMKGPAVMDYLKKANTVLALTDIRKAFSQIAGSLKGTSEAKEFWTNANTIYEKEKQARKEFELTKTNEFELYLLSDANFNFLKYDKQQEKYLKDTEERNSKIKSWKFDKMQNMSETEKTFYKNVLGTNIETKSKATVADMLSDLDNPFYAQQVAQKQNFQNILNALNHGK